MLKFLLGVATGGVLAVTATQAAEAFLGMASWLPDEVLEFIQDTDSSL